MPRRKAEPTEEVVFEEPVADEAEPGLAPEELAAAADETDTYEAEEVVTPEAKVVTVTADSDLRVVTEDLVVVRLTAGVPRQLAEPVAYAAQGCAAKAKVKLTIE